MRAARRRGEVVEVEVVVVVLCGHVGRQETVGEVVVVVPHGHVGRWEKEGGRW